MSFPCPPENMLCPRCPHQVFIAHSIAFTPVFGKVSITVDLNDQLQRHAAKVDGVRWNGMLAPKLLIADLAVANPLPNGGRKLIGTATLIPGERNCLR